MSLVAKSFGCSDVWLKKLCREFRVPTPPRGHWAKKRAGKPSRRQPLARSVDPDEVVLEIKPPEPELQEFLTGKELRQQSDSGREDCEVPLQRCVRVPSLESAGLRLTNVGGCRGTDVGNTVYAGLSRNDRRGRRHVGLHSRCSTIITHRQLQGMAVSVTIDRANLADTKQ